VTARRLPVLVVLVLALTALVLVDRSVSTSVRTDSLAAIALMPLASPPEAVSSAFFCAGGAAKPGAAFDSTLVIANPGSTPADVLVASYPGALASDTEGAAAVAKLKPLRKKITVGPRSRADVHLADIQVSPFAAAVVETNDPDIAVERRISGSSGARASSSPCASAPSENWYLPTGTTTRDARELLAVFNPFPVDAVVDVTFQTSDGFRTPPELQSLPVAGRQVRMLDISESVPRIEQLSATVVSRAGRVIVDRLQSFDGSDPKHPAGLAVMLGAPSAAPVWTFGEGQVIDGLNEVITVANPSDDILKAQLEVTLDDPSTNGVVDPIPVTVPAHAYAQVTMRDQTRVPPGIGHSVTVRSINKVGLVAERVITASAPAPRHGYAPALGAPLVATRWVLADGSAVSGQIAEFVVVVNPSPDTIARVRFTALAQGQPLAIDGLQDVEVAAGGRLTVELGQHVSRPDLPVIVEADRPVVIERGLYMAEGKGISLAAGIPLSEAASLPASPPPSTTTIPAEAPPPPSS
jgi:hypothetical protein